MRQLERTEFRRLTPKDVALTADRLHRVLLTAPSEAFSLNHLSVHVVGNLDRVRSGLRLLVSQGRAEVIPLHGTRETYWRAKQCTTDAG